MLCCGILIKHCRKVKSEKVITLQMAQQLKTKNINVVPGQLFCHKCKASFFYQRQTHCIDDQDNMNISKWNDFNITKTCS